ncbi:hypothetical protein PR048_020754 [Dryococelus australis]|uniref:Uncharacterized protein n=1 Tax=Dryococelus australis TaxID=614101 RepID=A0ABQ9GWE3_9NEOP|nr:hypothetical protein PR048_020754 [Dryococelus australis]
MCDRNFGHCGMKIKKEEKIHTWATYVELLEAARQNPIPFLFLGADVVDWCEVVFQASKECAEEETVRKSDEMYSDDDE